MYCGIIIVLENELLETFNLFEVQSKLKPKTLKKLVLLFSLTNLAIHAQNQKLGIVIDSETKKPIEFVDVYNKLDNTVTNEDGKYFILSSYDSISFYKLGYKEIKLKFEELSDTLYLSR